MGSQSDLAFLSQQLELRHTIMRNGIHRSLFSLITVAIRCGEPFTTAVDVMENVYMTRKLSLHNVRSSILIDVLGTNFGVRFIHSFNKPWKPLRA